MQENDRHRNVTPYTSEDGNTNVEIIVQNGSLWATKKILSDLFNTTEEKISNHLNEIYHEKELERKTTISKIEIVVTENDKQVKRLSDIYNIDAIIAVGYRTNTRRATQFRIWATNTLKQYILDGYIINEALLRESPKKLNELAAKLRELRSNEKNIFASVREVFKLASSDYEPSDLLVKSFYAKLQDKFHHAITKMTASKLILDRAEHSEPNMGMTQNNGKIATLSDAKIGKNYLREDELYRMHLLSEQFLLFAESTTLRGQEMTMQQLHDQLDKLLELNGYPVFDDYSDFHLKDRAMKHAEREFNQYLEIKQLEHLGIVVDLESYYDGEYDNYKYEANKIRPQQINKQLKIEADTVKIEEKLQKQPSNLDHDLKANCG